MSTSGGYHDAYEGTPSVCPGDTMSTSGGYEYIEGSSVRRGFQWCPSDVLNIPQCTHDVPPHAS